MKTLFQVSFFVSLGFVFLLSGCRKGSPECKEFCANGRLQQRAVFAAYPIEKQYHLYMTCGQEPLCDDDSIRCCSEFESELAQGGEANLQFLLHKLQAESLIDRKQNILYAVRQFGVRGHLRGRRDVVDSVKKSVGNLELNILERLLGGGEQKKRMQSLVFEIEFLHAFPTYSTQPSQ